MAVPLILFPEAGARWVLAAKNFVTQQLGVLYLLLGVLAMGFMANIGLDSIGRMLSNLVRMSTWTEPFGGLNGFPNSSFPQLDYFLLGLVAGLLAHHGLLCRTYLARSHHPADGGGRHLFRLHGVRGLLYYAG